MRSNYRMFILMMALNCTVSLASGDELSGGYDSDDRTGDYKEYLNNQSKEIDYRCNSLVVNVNGNSKLTGTVNCKNMEIYANGNGVIDVNGSVDKVIVTQINGNADVTLTGFDTEGFYLRGINSGKFAFDSKIKDAKINLIDDAIVDMSQADIDKFHLDMINGSAKGYFRIAGNAQIMSVTGRALLYVRGSISASDTPTLTIHEVNGDAEVHWCGLAVHTDIVHGNGKVIEDCE